MGGSSSSCLCAGAARSFRTSTAIFGCGLCNGFTPCAVFVFIVSLGPSVGRGRVLAIFFGAQGQPQPHTAPLPNCTLPHIHIATYGPQVAHMNFVAPAACACALALERRLWVCARCLAPWSFPACALAPCKTLHTFFFLCRGLSPRGFVDSVWAFRSFFVE